MLIKYEVYLIGDNKNEVIKKLNEKFKIKLKPMYNNIPEAKKHSDSEINFNNFYIFKKNVNEKEIWQAAYDLLDYDKENNFNCIKNVGPIISLCSSIFKPDKNNISNNPRWNHDITKFQDAIKFSKQQGRLQDKTDIKIAHIDTGYTLHPEIKKINKNEGKNFFEFNSYNNSIDKMNGPNPGHGTATASVIIGIETDLISKPMSPDENKFSEKDVNDGVFPYIELIPYRVFNSVIHIGFSSFPLAVFDAVDNGCQVITMSMGGMPLFDDSWENAVEYAYKKGVIFCAAAGNVVGFVVWPARFEHIIAVAGINFRSEPWKYSCRGKQVDVSAPGENVYVAVTTKEGKFLYNKYGCGTSFATPHVAAAAALWLNHFKNELNSQIFIDNPSKIVDTFCYALKTSAYRPVDWDKENWGAGILNVLELLKYEPKTCIEEIEKELKKDQLYSVFKSAPAKKGLNELSAKEKLIKKELIYNIVNSKIKNEIDLDKKIKKISTKEAIIKYEKIKTSRDLRSQISLKKNIKNIDEIKKDYIDYLLS